eukprot:CAMPEP_0205901094 /NCGR_PEP_ID=MMETSP1083-20121108/27496_1 /ASSEMBLY_ACC=CAM_ASM_000430 /TAXON_ID=97485 /ORGANISM="Prymnesium parvum, Strain Texoma1" /LENGTH=59 /DNA_ID=CAMNT_0053266595 /DNA_START=483 /DNA_END=662 /DNA_ORIENTATION=-
MKDASTFWHDVEPPDDPPPSQSGSWQCCLRHAYRMKGGWVGGCCDQPCASPNLPSGPHG